MFPNVSSLQESSSHLHLISKSMFHSVGGLSKFLEDNVVKQAKHHGITHISCCPHHQQQPASARVAMATTSSLEDHGHPKDAGPSPKPQAGNLAPSPRLEIKVALLQDSLLCSCRILKMWLVVGSSRGKSLAWFQKSYIHHHSSTIYILFLAADV